VCIAHNWSSTDESLMRIAECLDRKCKGGYIYVISHVSYINMNTWSEEQLISYW
jgi:hypothetical protein